MASLKVDSLFQQFGHLFKEHGPKAVKQVGAVFHFEVLPAKGQPPVVWTIDLKNGDGKIVRAKEGKPDTTFTLLDEDAIKLFEGKLQPQSAFMQGKLKIRGNMGAAMKFTPDLFPKPAKL